MRKILNILFALILSCDLFGQSDQYSHNMFNLMSVNPGYAGSSDMVCINALNRNQWMGFGDGTPNNSNFSVNAPFTLFDKSHGVGISVLRNTQGISTDIGCKLAYAYRSKMKIGDGHLGIGISAGFINSGAEYSKLNVNGAGDVNVPTGKESNTIYDLGFGVFYNTDKIYMGISTKNVLTGSYKFKTISAESYYLVPQYYITAGYRYQLSNPMFELVPSFFMQSSGNITNFNINTNLVYNNRIWGGLSYRVGQAFTALFGLELLAGVRFGVAYDYDTTDIGKISDGSLEVAVIYCFKLKKEKIPQRYKSIRFL